MSRKGIERRTVEPGGAADCFLHIVAKFDRVSVALLVGLAVLRLRPPRREVLFVIIAPTRRTGQEFGQPGITTFTPIGAVFGILGQRFAMTLGAVTGSTEDTCP
jgi:hypothetical protein